MKNQLKDFTLLLDGSKMPNGVSTHSTSFAIVGHSHTACGPVAQLTRTPVLLTAAVITNLAPVLVHDKWTVLKSLF